MRIRTPAAVLLIAATLAIAHQAHADKVFLKDGTVVEGQVSEAGDRYGVITDSGVQWYARDQVERIEYDLIKRVDAETRAAFLALKDRALREDDPAAAAALWEAYVAANPDGPLLPLARDEIDHWKQAVADGLVIFGGKLVRPSARDAAQRKAVELIDAALKLYHSTRFREAGKKLEEADRLWPDHPTVSFYMGFTLREARRPLDAARRFADVFKQIPEHVPSLNNTACVCAQLNDFRSAVTFLARALRRDVESELLCDNAWEILHMMETEKQQGVVRLDLLKMNKDEYQVLVEACAAQQNRKKAADRYRWGSQWVSRADLERFTEKINEINARQDALRLQIDQRRAQIAALDQRILVATKMREAAVRVGDGAGALVYQRQIRDAQEERSRIEQQAAALQEEGRRLERDRPKPVWTGELTLMDAESPLAGIPPGPPAPDGVRRAVLSGKAILVGGDGAPLGRVSVEPHHPKSIWDALGPHGSPYSDRSLFDPRSPYGRPTSYLSHQDPAATQPPALVLGGRVVCHVTTNPAFDPRITLETLVTLLRSSAAPPAPESP